MKTIVFYSYKGGVGRSLALANMAKRLTEFNKKVCLLDFDLEAPGLVHKFSSNLGDTPITAGVVDYIHEYYVNGRLPETIKEYAIDFSIYSNKADVTFIPAGNTNSNDYWKKLSAINWYDLLYGNNNGLAFFLDLKEKIRLELNPDFLLIDSRTGFTEMSGITMAIWADELVVLAANNKENLEGAQKIIKSVTSAESSLLGKIPKVTFVLSRVPFTEQPEDKTKEDNLKQRVRMQFEKAGIENKIMDGMVVIHSDRALEEEEELKIGYDKDQNSSQISRDYLTLFEKIIENALTSEEVQKFNDMKLAERLYDKAHFPDEINIRLEFLNKAIKLNPENIEYYKYRITLLFENSNYLDALIDCDHLLKINPNSLDAYTASAAIYNQIHKYNESLLMLDKASKIKPDSAFVYAQIGMTYSRIGDFDNALFFLDKSIDINSNLADVYNLKADVLNRMGNYEEAIDNIYKAIDLNSSDFMFYMTLAEVNANLSKENEFYLNLNMALKMASDYKEEIEKVLNNENVYKSFYNQPRFRKLMDKYNIILDDDLKSSKS